ncbi:MAG: hypothetical protein QMC60_04040 [Amylibacter sp.]|jgi:hypothetical protein|tara:strand:+ start:45495 stop:46154 length:660 start_codon:yes stop_codon:yes gene_type:complete
MTELALSSAKIEALFSHADGIFRFARWSRPIVPVVFGVDDETLKHIKSAIVTTVGITGFKIEETDPELGANFMWFFCHNWDEILAVPDLENLIPNLKDIITKLQFTQTSTYRIFSFDPDGGINMCVQLIKVFGDTAKMSIQALTTGETYQCLALFGPNAFLKESPIAVIKENSLCIPKPNYAALIRAAYDPVLPHATQEPSHSLRLSARANILLLDMIQ